MSVHDERELRDRLTGLLDGLEPSPAPVASAVRRGKGIRMRRWISVAAGLAVIVSGVAFLPGLLRPPRTAPAGHPHYRVTVHPAGRHSPVGLIAYGSVNAKKWRATASHQGKSILVSLCGGSYAALSYPGAVGPSGVTAFSGGNTSNATDWCMVSEVSRGVSMITMALDNGQSIGLQPVSYRGVPLIAFALPAHGRILRLTAFEGARMVAYAIPFNEPASQTIASWLRPGQPAPAVSAARLQTALHGRGRWTASVHVGPWGMCAVIRFSKGVDTGCGPMRPQMQLVSFAFGGGNGPTVVGTQADVAYLVLTMKNGTTDRVTVAHIAGTGYFAIGASRDSGLAGWTA
ncbi:MAG TPA: hypothetical protein VGI66_06245, partial [Streptosporangiaceae bacterium]